MSATMIDKERQEAARLDVMKAYTIFETSSNKDEPFGYRAEDFDGLPAKDVPVEKADWVNALQILNDRRWERGDAVIAELEPPPLRCSTCSNVVSLVL